MAKKLNLKGTKKIPKKKGAGTLREHLKCLKG